MGTSGNQRTADWGGADNWEGRLERAAQLPLYLVKEFGCILELIRKLSKR
jgi:hypothetical protein